jgi:hypothetical protein
LKEVFTGRRVTSSLAIAESEDQETGRKVTGSFSAGRRYTYPLRLIDHG